MANKRPTDEKAVWLVLTPDRKTIKFKGNYSQCQGYWRRSGKERLVIRREDSLPAKAEGHQHDL
nr:MAG TPA: hypothetical protein [Caudoviricetes sp.]